VLGARGTRSDVAGGGGLAQARLRTAASNSRGYVTACRPVACMRPAEQHYGALAHVMTAGWPGHSRREMTFQPASSSCWASASRSSSPAARSMMREPSGSRRALATSSGVTMPWTVGVTHLPSGDEAVAGRRQRVTIDPTDRTVSATRFGARPTTRGSPGPRTICTAGLWASSEPGSRTPRRHPRAGSARGHSSGGRHPRRSPVRQLDGSPLNLPHNAGEGGVVEAAADRHRGHGVEQILARPHPLSVGHAVSCCLTRQATRRLPTLPDRPGGWYTPGAWPPPRSPPTRRHRDRHRYHHGR
jgi:hypothetical protein